MKSRLQKGFEIALKAYRPVAVRVAVAAVLLLGAWYLQSIQSLPPTMTAQPLRGALMLSTAVQTGQPVLETSIRVVQLDPRYLAPNAITLDQWPRLSEMVARLPLAQGQVLTLHDLVKPPRVSDQTTHAELWVPLASVSGLPEDAGERGRYDLHGINERIDDVQLSRVGNGWLLQVEPGDTERLVKLARQPIHAVRCPVSGCPVPERAEESKPVKTQKIAPARAPSLIVSYGVKP